ncbi:hypothetical protein [Arenimonas oryziterrae]|uniref:Uncharacterized protein n=1 Tax=Arenimonas oryziterrae DSM 21050 = YC6267 TaxID=1121015 RepID=A0A091ASN5_9GAMM|nr:hypothetical protein [Arenimonas oryziterrae]KFN43203.1 hypothetical protein N789_11615 [Arenimonas oryziterrae DSM 21050 = YC6267]
MSASTKSFFIAFGLLAVTIAIASWANPALSASPAVESHEFKVAYSRNAPESIEMQSIAAFAGASKIEVISLLPWDASAYFARERKLAPPDDASEAVKKAYYSGETERQQRDQEEWCRPGPCIEGNRVLGTVSVDSPERIAKIQEILQAWYETAPNYGLACISQYHHAVAFTSAGKHYQVLLCYHCGQYTILVDGKSSPDNQGAHSIGLSDINAWLEEAGIPYNVPEH